MQLIDYKAQIFNDDEALEITFKASSEETAERYANEIANNTFEFAMMVTVEEIEPPKELEQASSLTGMKM